MRYRRCTLVLAAALAGCAAAPPEAPVAERLVDLYEPKMVSGSPPAAASPAAPLAWRFLAPFASPDGAKDATLGWKGRRVAGLALGAAGLTGRSLDTFPLVYLDRRADADDRDLLHAVEVRLRASAGANLSASFSGEEKADLDEIVAAAEAFPWSARTPIVAGPELKTYTLRSRRPVTASGVRHIFLRPTDAAGATFEIESIKLIFRKEYLASVPSGVGWQGLSEIYHETIVSRAPESVRLDLDLPAHPWLDLSIGTVETGPVGFRVEADGRSVLERTVTTPHRWERTPVDLTAFAGKKVALTLSVTAEHPGALGFWGSPVVREHAKAPPRGVILVWADTLRRDHLQIYGYRRPTSPTLERLAAGGTLFRDCVSQATWTKVATPSLFTSLFPTSHTVRDFSDRLPSSATTIAEVFRDAGYATLSLSSILFTGAFTNMHQGFEELHEDGSLPDQESSKTSRIYVDRLLPWLEAHRDTPFFVFLHVSDPHDPYKPYAPYDTLFADPAKAEEHERQLDQARKFIAEPLLKRFGMPTRDEMVKAGIDPDAYVAHDRDWYDGSIRAMDAEIGRLWERLRTLGLESSTLLVFTGDHGEEFLEHGRTFHGQSVYGELTNAPLLFYRPGGVPGGKIVEETVRTIDIMPTILALSGLAAPEGIAGRSLAGLIEGSAKGPGGAVAAERAPYVVSEKAVTAEVGGGPPPHDTESYAIVEEGWKLIHNVKRHAGRPEFELYREREDPLNASDLAGAHPDIVKRLSDHLAAWRAQANDARLAPDSEATRSMSPEELKRLRSLGYVQ
ncbi:MAG TPA: sulfatase [Candidatus Polarisedimenticolaceae bacterium]|nr:sulfatase [Candidatus Polarisedimenticolaceae bacterium]